MLFQTLKKSLVNWTIFNIFQGHNYKHYKKKQNNDIKCTQHANQTKILLITLYETDRSDPRAVHKLHTLLPTSVLTKASLWYETGVLWANITQIKSNVMSFGFCLLTDINQTFQMRYLTSLYVKRLQKYQRSKLEVGK